MSEEKLTAPFQLSYQIASENAVICYLEPVCNATKQDQQQFYAAIVSFAEQIKCHCASYIIEVIPAYHSVLLVYDIMKVDLDTIVKAIEKLLKHIESTVYSDVKHIDIPVYYGEEVGLDLGNIAQQTKLTPRQIVTLHQERDYYVHAIGFAAGFSYIGDLNPALSVSRKQTPRIKVPKGSVAIANQKTAVYPAEMPGGWHIIGRTPLEMFDRLAIPPMKVSVGDKVRFYSINKQEFLSMGGVL